MLRKYFLPMFHFNSKEQLSIAGCIGLAIGILPLYGYRGVFVVALLLVLRLNIIAFLLGFGVSFIMPAAFAAISIFADSLADSDAMSGFFRLFFTGGFFGSKYYSGNETGLFFTFDFMTALVSVGLFYSLYSFLFNEYFKKDVKINKYALVSAVGMFIGAFPMSKYSLIALGITFLLFRSNILPILGGFVLGTTFVGNVLNFAVYAVGRCEDNYVLSKIITGRISFGELWGLKPAQQSIALILVAFLILVILSSHSGLSFIYKHACDGGTAGKKYVFHDVSGTRWLLIKRITSAFLIMILVAFILFGLSTRSQAAANEYTVDYSTDMEDSDKDLELPAINPENPLDIYAFYVSWDIKSKRSFETYKNRIDVLIPDWLYLHKDYSIEYKYDKDIDRIASESKISVIPLINNYVDEKWNASIVHKLLDDKQLQRDFIEEITGIIRNNGYAGLNLDFEYIDKAHKDRYTAFVKALKASLSKCGLKLIIDVQVGNPAFDYPALSKVADKLVLMLYDEHFGTTKPGSVSSAGWFEKSMRSSGVPKEKLIAGIGLYGYDWEVGSSKPGLGYTFNEIMQIASENKASFLWDSNKKTPVLKYTAKGREHVLHFNDATVFYNQLKLTVGFGANAVGIWRLGSEDASIWDLIGMLHDKNIKASGFIKPRLIDEAAVSGDGEIITGYTPGTEGIRVFKTDKDGFIEKVNYLSFPRMSSVLSLQRPKEKVVALTFDDGPDPIYTEKILDVLKKYDIKATFFVVGANGDRNPELISRMYREGHEVGNHTYNHINIEIESAEKLKNELKMTNQTIVDSTGHGTILFRPPYDNGLDMSEEKALQTFMKVNGLGFVMVGNNIDSRDWDEKTSDRITENVENNLENGNIILMHDGGGDRSATVEALPDIFESLKEKGYQFVTVGELLGETGTQTMPPASIMQLSLDKAAYFVNAVKEILPGIITKFFYISTAIGFLRFFFLMFFATKQKRDYRRKRFDNAAGFKPKVSIVVAAYNEEKVICKTVNSLLQSDYGNLEIIVVNDGSKDNTAWVVKETYGDNPIVRLINKENGGKSSAVNRGFMEADGEFVVVLDADTIISKDAVSLMIRHFADPNVAAVSGNVKVGNKRNIWTIWQHVEYVTGLNLERRAFDALNCITVVPGAIGAWRKELVKKAGYYKEDTLAEDADITLTFLQQGYKIVYEEGAKAFTEAPEDLKGLLKQRVRWAYGTLQCLWKHRDALFNKTQKSLGFVALPNTWLYQVVFQSLSPLTDILFFLGLFGGHSIGTVVTYIVFFLVDFSITCYAFRLEKESMRPLLMLFIQRIVYRQLMTYVVYKSILSALRGVKVGWNKLNRLGNVPQ